MSFCDWRGDSSSASRPENETSDVRHQRGLSVEDVVMSPDDSDDVR